MQDFFRLFFSAFRIYFSRDVPSGTLEVHAGAEYTHVGYAEYGNVNYSIPLLGGGWSVDQVLQDFLRQRFRLNLDAKTAEQLKYSIDPSYR